MACVIWGAPGQLSNTRLLPAPRPLPPPPACPLPPSSLFLIVMTSVVLGTGLPFALARAGVDPANGRWGWGLPGMPIQEKATAWCGVGVVLCERGVHWCLFASVPAVLPDVPLVTAPPPELMPPRCAFPCLSTGALLPKCSWDKHPGGSGLLVAQVTPGSPCTASTATSPSVSCWQQPVPRQTAFHVPRRVPAIRHTISTYGIPELLCAPKLEMVYTGLYIVTYRTLPAPPGPHRAGADGHPRSG